MTNDSPQPPSLAPNRRDVVLSAAALGTIFWLPGSLGRIQGAAAQDAPTDPQPFSPDMIIKLAEELASKDFKRPSIQADDAFNALTAEQYADIRFRPEQALWREDRLGCEIFLVPRGWIYDTPVSVRIVENGRATKLVADSRLFEIGGKIANPPAAAPYAFSGFRVRTPLSRSDTMEDTLVFQGASYFRAIGRGQVYGLSARGLAVNTAQPGGEEFPIFRAFWIEKPATPGAGIVIHALLDCPSVAGAYRFTVGAAGGATVCDIEAHLFPRRPLKHIGIAPLTSMFLRGDANRRIGGDIRPSVHNSEGLMIFNGRGERIWRPLTNPRTLQTSAFMDTSPQAFGLIQRARDIARFDDLTSAFERRPSVWVEPRGAWGEGFVELIEIPSEEEIHDNIVAYWNPAKNLEPGQAHVFAYRLTWGDDAPFARAPAEVQKTSVGETRKEGVLQFAVDFTGPALGAGANPPVADVRASAGVVTAVAVRRHPGTGGVRVEFRLETGGTEMIELRLALKHAETTISETWLYRWTA